VLVISVNAVKQLCLVTGGLSRYRCHPTVLSTPTGRTLTRQLGCLGWRCHPIDNASGHLQAGLGDRKSCCVLGEGVTWAPIARSSFPRRGTPSHTGIHRFRFAFCFFPIATRSSFETLASQHHLPFIHAVRSCYLIFVPLWLTTSLLQLYQDHTRPSPSPLALTLVLPLALQACSLAAPRQAATPSRVPQRSPPQA
jgi:hypothetical protein